jgi:hypothetical protein
MAPAEVSKSKPNGQGEQEKLSHTTIGSWHRKCIFGTHAAKLRHKNHHAHQITSLPATLVTPRQETGSRVVSSPICHDEPVSAYLEDVLSLMAIISHQSDSSAGYKRQVPQNAPSFQNASSRNKILLHTQEINKKWVASICVNKCRTGWEHDDLLGPNDRGGGHLRKSFHHPLAGCQWPPGGLAVHTGESPMRTCFRRRSAWLRRGQAGSWEERNRPISAKIIQN